MFKAAAQELGGIHTGTFCGGACWQFHPFPKMPVQIRFFEKDDEFPAEVQFLFDETALYYMGFESLGALSGSVLHSLGSAAKV